MTAPRSKYRMAASLAVALLAASCALPPGAERGALGVIDNVLSHEGPPPPAPERVRRLLADPRAAMDAAGIFRGEVPEAIERLARAPRPAGADTPLARVIDAYLEDLARAQRALRSAVAQGEAIPDELPSPAAQRELAGRVDRTWLRHAAELFMAAHLRLLEQRIAYPPVGARYALGDITVIVGTAGDDVHAVSAVREGAVLVILEPGGDDRYEGGQVAAGGLAAILDLAGNDRYASAGASWGAALAGVSLLYDADGDDSYQSGRFAQGAALAGFAVLIDVRGNDEYRVRSFGQGLGLALGTGILWDLDGSDRYAADGEVDPFARGASLSYAQGAAVGVRAGMGGGVGILRDEAGDDTYAAQLYAQGAAYYYGLGLLWDRGGNDRYEAARYSQGAGVHQAVGVLRDEDGKDAYALGVGVGQGAGVDLAVGALVDAAGDDRYRAPTLAQGAATANGVGLFADQAGNDDARLEHPPGRGLAEWSRGLPSVALVLGEPPRRLEDAAHEPEPGTTCPAEPSVAPADIGIAQALRAFGPELIRDAVAPAGYARLMAELRERPAQSLAALPSSEFDVLWPLATALRCALAGASAAQAAGLWEALEATLEADSASRYAGVIAFAMRERPPPEAQRDLLLARLGAHPSCGVRTAGLRLGASVAAAQAALRSTCWQLQAQALRVLETRGVAPEDLSRVPPFLRPAPAISRGPRRAP